MTPLMITFLVMLALVAGAVAVNVVKYVVAAYSGFVKGFFKGIAAFIKSPIKFIKASKARRLERKIRRTERKLVKKVMKEDHKARVNSALVNPSYISAKKVKPTATKLEALKAKRK